VTVKGSLLMSLPVRKRFWCNAHAPCHVTQSMWSQITTYMESPTIYCLFSLQLSGAAVTIKGSIPMSLPDIKRLWRNAHASCHVTQGMGVANNDIYGIPNPILTIHFTTFRGLR